MLIDKTTRKSATRIAMLCCGAIVSLAGETAYAQTSFGAIVGTVSDASGADVNGAHVTVTNTGTSATETTSTGSSGTYSFLNLNPGSYTVAVSDEGFGSTTRNQIDVKIGGSTRVDVSLSVGDVSQNVTVSAAQNELQTDSSSLTGVVEGKQVVESPLNGRDVNNLLTFIPGVVAGGGTAGSTVSNQSSGQTQAIAYGNYQIGGGFSGQSLFFIDGVESNVPENNVNSLVPTQDAVQEFRVSTNNISAEFGGFGGGVVQISTKSGTNQFHGSAYEYFRNTVLDANDFFSNRNGLAREPLHQNQYGANVGGPILKNKAFFFFSWERESLNQGLISTNTLPTAAEVGGDFSALGSTQPIYDPATGGTTQFANNVIPANRLDASAVKIIQTEAPAPNLPGLTSNFITTAHTEGVQNEYNSRVDYTLSPADSLFVRYTFWNPNNGPSDPLGTKVGSGVTGNTTNEGVVGDNHIFNSTTIADLRLAYLRNYNFQTPLASGYNDSLLGPAYGTVQSASENKQGLLPALTIPGYSVGANNSQLYWTNNIYSINGSITKIIGRHTIKAGGIVRQVAWTTGSNSQGINFTSNAAVTGNTAVPNSGNALASFLLGMPVTTSITQVQGTHAFFHAYGFYATDTFQASNKLTVNLGLRWNQPNAYSEVNNLDTILQPNAASPLGTIVNPVTGQKQALTGNLAFVDSAAYPSRREESLHWKLFDPRVGFAYRLTSQTVVRGGYGISYLPANLTQDGPQINTINSATTTLSQGNNTVSNPFPSGLLQPSGRNPAGLTALLGETISARIPDQAYGYVQQYNAAIEQAIGSKSSFTLAYAANKGTHLTLSDGYTESGRNLNQLPDQYDSMGSALLTPIANPFAGNISGSGPLAGPTVLTGYLLRPHPQYQAVNQTVPRVGASTYNALQGSFQTRFSNGGTLQVAYTWSKLLSNTDNTSSFLDGTTNGVVQDYTNLSAEKSLSLQDIRQNAVINYGIDLPFGRGRMYLGHVNRVTDAVVSGWRVNGITTFRSGTPIPVVAAQNYLNEYFGSGTIRPNVVASCARQITGSAQSRVGEWFNTSCFTQPGQFSFGNESRVDSVLRSAGVANFDFAGTKSVKITEASNVQFTAELFNLFNRAQFAAPDSALNDATYGQVTSQANNPRQVQFALRYTF